MCSRGAVEVSGSGGPGASCIDLSQCQTVWAHLHFNGAVTVGAVTASWQPTSAVVASGRRPSRCLVCLFVSCQETGCKLCLLSACLLAWFWCAPGPCAHVHRGLPFCTLFPLLLFCWTRHLFVPRRTCPRGPLAVVASCWLLLFGFLGLPSELLLSKPVSMHT